MEGKPQKVSLHAVGVVLYTTLREQRGRVPLHPTNKTWDIKTYLDNLVGAAYQDERAKGDWVNPPRRGQHSDLYGYTDINRVIRRIASWIQEPQESLDAKAKARHERRRNDLERIGITQDVLASVSVQLFPLSPSSK